MDTVKNSSVILISRYFCSHNSHPLDLYILTQKGGLYRIQYAWNLLAMTGSTLWKAVCQTYFYLKIFCGIILGKPFLWNR